MLTPATAAKGVGGALVLGGGGTGIYFAVRPGPNYEPDIGLDKEEFKAGRWDDKDFEDSWGNKNRDKVYRAYLTTFPNGRYLVSELSNSVSQELAGDASPSEKIVENWCEGRKKEEKGSDWRAVKYWCFKDRKTIKDKVDVGTKKVRTFNNRSGSYDYKALLERLKTIDHEKSILEETLTLYESEWDALSSWCSYRQWIFTFNETEPLANIVKDFCLSEDGQ